MIRSRILVCAALLFPLLAGAASRQPASEPPVTYVDGPGVVITSTGTAASLAARETAGPDTFVLYGGPDHPTEGKFQLADGVTPDWGDGTGDLLPRNYGGGPGAWESHDMTDIPNYWHRSQFNGDLLGDPGNHVFWCGTGNGDANEVPVVGWATPPGYGNDWNESAVFRFTMLDPSVGQTIELDFDYNSETEPGYDYFLVEFDSFWDWTEVLRCDAWNAATTFAAQGPRPIVYEPYTYSGLEGDQIAIRLRVDTDEAWSDEDGIWPTSGAVQVDNISLSFTDGVSVHEFTEDFEDEKEDWEYLFVPDKEKFAGDFADVYARFTDIDPCRENPTPVVGFIDYGQTVRNWRNHPEYLVNGDSTTGGSLSGVSYGVPGNYVTNYTGGLSSGEIRLQNEIWSPWIAWDLPTTEDDGGDFSGAVLRWSTWLDLPLVEGFFGVWHVRSLAGTPGVDAPGSWRDFNFVIAERRGSYWVNLRRDVSVLIDPSPDYVQVAFGVIDYASVFGFPGNSATPSPVIDNVSFAKYRVGGPVLSTRILDLAQDGFPVNGSINPADADLLDIPFDMANDVNTGDVVIGRGDSVIVDVASTIPGVAVTDIRMVWALQQNTALSFTEVQPSRPKDESFQDLGGGVWTGEVVADTSTTSIGAVVDDRFFVDLPDEDFLHPGAVLHYYILATDSDGRVSTLPTDTTGFGDFSRPANVAYDRRFTVRGLPTLTDGGSQPGLLVYNAFGRRGEEPAWTTSLHALGFEEGAHYDTYTVQGPESKTSNGIGAAGPGQLDGYETILYLTGDLQRALLSNGDEDHGNNDKANDLGILNDWLADPGSARNFAAFGNHVGSGNSDSTEGAAFVQTVLGVEVLGLDVSAVIGGQAAPRVAPSLSTSLASFETEFVAYGGCQEASITPLQTTHARVSVALFDQIQPLPGAEAGHYFLDPAGVPITAPGAGVASVVHDHGNGVAITFPYSSMVVLDPVSRTAGPSARTQLLGEILDLFGSSGGTPPVTSAPEVRRSVLSLQPNPFNPSTLVSFSNTFGKRGSVKVYNLRGELVRTLHDGEFSQAGGFSRIWDGTDDNGAVVASGVYVIQARADGQVETKKAALVK